MKTITQREFRNNSAAVMDDVERGETYRITRAGTPVAELRPLPARRRYVPTEELAQAVAALPHVDYEAMRRDTDEFFGDGGDRVD
ncbi:MAG: type II toxin-antitoxin system Phd/YefM family antitoxin [Micromonosporaceae bacterium]